ncbi:MAG: hypothetical protein KDD62_10690, partial [Bdellovibrionales bacterium]|nr:hypothetical protein [Bdellovibrionales bacterium]
RLHDDCGASISQYTVELSLGDKFPADRLVFFYHNRVLPLWHFFSKIFTFHASAFDFGGSAVVLMGNSGVGKSTTVLKFSELGGKLIAEDMLGVAMTGNRLVPVMGPPWIRLCDDVFSALPALTVQKFVWEYRDGKHIGLQKYSQFTARTLNHIGVLVELTRDDGEPRRMSPEEVRTRLLNSIRYGRLAFRLFGPDAWKLLNSFATRVPAYRVNRKDLNLNFLNSITPTNGREECGGAFHTL